MACKTVEKLHQIQPYMWMTIAGGVADAQYLIGTLKMETNLYNIDNEKPMNVKS